ncbi:hypothetical protein [Tenacibaculum agarivorans]|uniref:hypothetical protein n=1 Tax=Tenacibaculum agarivorans TaxID=1908389 RepID=UPI00094B8A70|nr:hypothetical protein [Tenacibaculum agarivorans]
MKKLLNLKTTQILGKEQQKSIIGGKLAASSMCSNSICSNLPGRCCGFDSAGNYGCVVALPGNRNCR